MTDTPFPDPSNGYDAIVETYVKARSNTGRQLVQAWVGTLRSGADILDLGAGTGEPITSALIEAGCHVSALDASPAMVDLFRERFPEIPIVCEPVETSDFFNRKFDAVVAIGLVFLLKAPAQTALMERVSAALKPGGRFLFSAPVEIGAWSDLLTGQTSQSLGRDAYVSALKEAGFEQIESRHDEGGSHYYDAHKPLA